MPVLAILAILSLEDKAGGLFLLQIRSYHQRPTGVVLLVHFNGWALNFMLYTLAAEVALFGEVVLVRVPVGDV